MHNRSHLKYIDRLYQLSQISAVDPDQAATYVDQVMRSAEPQAGSTQVTFGHLVEKLENLVFPADERISPTNESGLSSISSRDEMVNQIPADFALNPRTPDIFRRIETGKFLNSRVGLHFHAMTLRERFDLWTGLQDDLPAPRLRAKRILDSLLESFLDEMSGVEKRAFESEMDDQLVRQVLNTYWSTFYNPVPPTLRSVTEIRGKSTTGSTVSDRDPSGFSDSSSAKKSVFSFKRSLLFGLVMVGAAVAANSLYKVGIPEPPTRAITLLSISSADEIGPDFSTSSAEQAEMYIKDRFGVTLQVPVIRDTQLLGVRIQLLKEELEVPVLLFHDGVENKTFPVFAYSYAFLQANRRRVELSRKILLRIDDPSQFGVYFSDEGSALIWRSRDDIFVAVLQVDPARMQERVEVP